MSKRAFFLVDAFPKLSETFVVQQIVGLLERGWEVRIVADQAGGDSEQQPEVQQYDLLGKVDAPHSRSLVGKLPALAWFALKHPGFMRGYKFGSRYHLYALLSLPQLAALDVRPDDVVIANFGTNGIKAAQLKRLGKQFKLATIFHGYDVSSFLRIEPPHVYSEVFKQSNKLLPISDFWRQKLLQLGAPDSKIEVFHMGVNLDDFVPKARANTGKNSSFTCVSTGRLAEKKGFAYAIEGFAKALPRLGDKAHYYIIGGGPLEAELHALCERLGVSERVTLLGPQKNTVVREWLAKADAFIVPSVTAANGDMEGIPVVMMEAQAMKIPVIATDHSGLKEGIIDGKTGLLVPERDADALAKSLIELAADPAKRRRFGEAGRSFIQKNFNAKTQDERLAQIADEMQRG